MSGELQGISSWRTWRRISSEDTLVTDFKPANYAAAKSIRLDDGTSAIAMRGFGKDADNETAIIVVSGWMSTPSAGGVGPGQQLWRGQALLGSRSSAMIPLADAPGSSPWGASATWFEVDTWDPTVPNGLNACVGTMFDGGNQSLLILPTLGYTALMLEIGDLGTGAEMAEIGVLWRPVSRAGVV